MTDDENGELTEKGSDVRDTKKKHLDEAEGSDD